MRQYTERACSDRFVARHLGPDATDRRKILCEDPDLRFCTILPTCIAGQRAVRRTIMARAGPCSQAAGVTEMTRLAPRRQARRRAARKVEKVRTYGLSPARPTPLQRGRPALAAAQIETRLIRMKASISPR